MSMYLEDSAVPFPLYSIDTSSKCRFQFFIITGAGTSSKISTMTGKKLSGASTISLSTAIRLLHYLSINDGVRKDTK